MRTRIPADAQYFYDLAHDLGETRNLASAQPAHTVGLKAKIDAWEASLEPPLYRQSGRQAPARPD